jgi:hypothetical protein
MDKNLKDLLDNLIAGATGAADANANMERTVRESLKDSNLPEAIINEIIGIMPDVMAEFMENPKQRFSAVEDICAVTSENIPDKLCSQVPAAREHRMWYRVHINITVTDVKGAVGVAAVEIGGEEMLTGTKEIHFSDIVRRHLVKEVGNEHYVSDAMVANIVNTEWEKYSAAMKSMDGVIDLLRKLFIS